MARENQDLQIALIISVMLTIILGVATFLCYRQYTDTAKSLQAALADGNKKQQEADKARNDCSQLKKYLGLAESASIEEVSKQFDDDMNKYGGASGPNDRFYHPLVEKLYLTIQDKVKELDTTTDENKQLKNQYVIRESTKDAQLKEFDDKINQVKQDLKTVSETYRKDNERFTEEANKIKDQLQIAQKEAAAAQSKADARLQEESEQLKKTVTLAKELREQNAKLTNPSMDIPDGEISWVNQRNGTVWINVGSADNLNALTSFAVYPADMSNLGKGAKKASIEVTKIINDHVAEARITDDKVTNPIMPGDKIHTPIWSPGDKRHFALAGFMDVDGDGKNNQQLLHNLISLSGGAIDCEVDEKGKQVGEITLQTRYIVLGDNPMEKGDPTGVDAYTKIQADAQSLGIQSISLSELLERMGYKPQAHMVSFGAGKNPNDFKAKPEGGVNRVSTGNVSELYKPREAPRSNAGGAY